MQISGIGNGFYDFGSSISNTEQKNESSTASTEQLGKTKVERAQQFLAEASQNYAEQTGAIMDKITDQMAVAQEIYRRMASGAKVAPSDEQTLSSYNFKLYMAAKTAQQMAERHEDLSDESLTEEFEERHANDRKDWTTELEGRISELHIGVGSSDETAATKAVTENSTTVITEDAVEGINVTI